MLIDQQAANHLPLFPQLVDQQPPQPSERAIRATRRAAQWRADVTREWSYWRGRARSAEEGARYDEAFDRLLQEGPDFLRYHGESDFTTPPRLKIDRNDRAKLMVMARAIERGSWKIRDKGKHGGALGRVATRILEVLLFIVAVNNAGLCVSYERLAELAGMCRRTAFSAIQTLALMGFVTIHRRIKRIKTELGFKVVQDTNAYEVHPPRGLGAIAAELFGARSECRKYTAKESSYQESRRAAGKEPPWGRPNGVWSDLSEQWEVT